MAGFSAHGTAFGYSTAMSVLDLTTRPTAWTYVGELTNITGPAISVDTIDVTAHGATGAYRQFAAGMIDGGDIGLEGNLLTAAAGNQMVDIANSRAVVSFVVKFVSTGTWLMNGVVNTFETDAPHDGKISFTSGIKLSGKPFLTSTYTTTT